MCTDIKWKIRAWPPFTTSQCDHPHESPELGCISILLAQLDAIVLADMAGSIQVWERTASDPNWHSWTDEAIPIEPLKERVAQRSLDWIARLASVTDDEVHEVAHTTYGTSLEGVGHGQG